MCMDRIYTEATISKSLVDDKWETDEHGNPIVIIEASNEELDYEGEKVLKSALLGSKKYFIENGVISYDHKHLLKGEEAKAYDADYNPEKYILGKPVEAWEGISEETGKPTVFVKAVLSKSNAIAKEIITKLRDKLKTVKASVGGRRVVRETRFNPSNYKEVPTIVGVDWDEVALTYKPVNQSLGATVLSPKEFVKSLTAGSSSDPGSMGTGGNTLQMQGSEKDIVSALMTQIRKKKITKSCDAINHLVNAGVPKIRAGNILKMLIDNNYIGDVIMAEEKTANDVIDTSTDELLKAISELEDGGDMSKGMSDGKYVRKNGHMYKMKKGGGYEKMDPESPDYEEEEEKVEKSLKGDYGEEGYDATQDVIDLKKSVSDLHEELGETRSMIKSMADVIDKQSKVIIEVGKAANEQKEMVKSIKDAPAPRAASVKNLNVTPRFEKSQLEKMVKVSESTLVKSMIDNKVNPIERSEVNHIFRRSGIKGVIEQKPHIAEMLVKE